MASLTISIDDEAKKILTYRAKKNFLTLREQIENIIRKSAIRTKGLKKVGDVKVDDRLVSIFSKSNRGRKKKK